MMARVREKLVDNEVIQNSRCLGDYAMIVGVSVTFNPQVMKYGEKYAEEEEINRTNEKLNDKMKLEIIFQEGVIREP